MKYEEICTLLMLNVFIFYKKSIRLPCGESRLADINNLFREKSILKFPDLVTYKTGISMLKAFACELPTQLQARFSRYIDVHNTRSTNSLVVLQSRTNFKAMCLSIHGVKGKNGSKNLVVFVLNQSSSNFTHNVNMYDTKRYTNRTKILGHFYQSYGSHL